jgi:putative membrane protein insertion efficiency factor
MIRQVIIFIIGLYQKFLSPFTGTSCRFFPSCSHYSVQALEKYGLVKGVWLTLTRVARCHPFHPGGHDPVK